MFALIARFHFKMSDLTRHEKEILLAKKKTKTNKKNNNNSNNKNRKIKDELHYGAFSC